MTPSLKRPTPRGSTSAIGAVDGLIRRTMRRLVQRPQPAGTNGTCRENWRGWLGRFLEYRREERRSRTERSTLMETAKDRRRNSARKALREPGPTQSPQLHRI